MLFVSDSVSVGKDYESQYQSRSRLGTASQPRIRIGVSKAGLVSVWCLPRKHIFQNIYVVNIFSLHKH